MEELIMKNDMEYRLTMREKNVLKKIHLRKDNYEKSIEVHNELRLNVDEQQYDIKNFKYQSDIDDEDEAMKNWIEKNIPEEQRKEAYKHNYEACETTCCECT